MTYEEIIDNLKNKLNDLHNGYQTYLEHGGKQDIETENDIESLCMAIEALQEKDHRCENCGNAEDAGVRIYCLLHTSFHKLDEYCSEWEEDNGLRRLRRNL